MNDEISSKTIPNWAIYLLILAILVSFIAYVFLVNYYRAKVNRKYVECQSNCTAIGKALELYSSDNEGKYPISLKSLIPNYIKTIPTCPSAGKDTYSNSYSISMDHKNYTIYCEGENHLKVGAQRNFPMYTSIYGIILNKRLLQRGILDSFRHAAREKNLDSVKKLIKNNPSILTTRNSSGETALLIVTDMRKQEIAQFLIEEGADVNSINNVGWTPLFIAINNKDFKMAKLMMDNGAKLNIQDRDGCTALHWAVLNNDKEITKLLVSYGVSKNIKDKDGYTPLEIAEKNNREIYEVLKESGQKK